MQRMTLTFLLGCGLALGACDSDDDGGGGDTDSGTGTDASSTSSASASASESASDTAESDSDSDSNSGPDSTSSSGGGDGSSGSSGGSSSTGGSGSSSTGSGSSSTGGDDGLYGPCPADQACLGDYQCQQIEMGPNQGINWCTQPCDVRAQDCPAPADGDAEPLCRGGSNGGDAICVLPCGEGTTCPTDMECFQVGGGGNFGVCAFPADF